MSSTGDSVCRVIEAAAHVSGRAILNIVCLFLKMCSAAQCCMCTLEQISMGSQEEESTIS